MPLALGYKGQAKFSFNLSKEPLREGGAKHGLLSCRKDTTRSCLLRGRLRTLYTYKQPRHVTTGVARGIKE